MLCAAMPNDSVLGDLKETGYEEKPAAQVVESLLKGIRARPNNDALLTKLQKILSP